MLFLRTVIARARPVVSLCWYGVSVFGISLIGLYGIFGIGLQASLVVIANTTRLTLPALYWLDHQSGADLLDGVTSNARLVDKLFQEICGTIALCAMALRVWRRRRQAARGLASTEVSAVANKNSTARDA
ncbi:hypothetical protein [Acetobacter fabarum]|uniref:hypothetical protein n=1 Tax=Acetobacter fabarum TaxID=483199 RepID=UPI0039EB6537